MGHLYHGYVSHNQRVSLSWSKYSSANGIFVAKSGRFHWEIHQEPQFVSWDFFGTRSMDRIWRDHMDVTRMELEYYTLWLCQNSYWKWHIYTGFSHWKWWFSMVMLVYQRVVRFSWIRTNYNQLGRTTFYCSVPCLAPLFLLSPALYQVSSVSLHKRCIRNM